MMPSSAPISPEGNGLSRGVQRSNHTGSQITAILLLAAVSLGVVVMGGSRLWVLLPLSGLLALILIAQCVRLFTGFEGLKLPAPDAIDASATGFLLYTSIRWLSAPSEFLARQEFFIIAGCAIVFWTARYGIQRRTHALIILFGLLVVATGVTAFAFWHRSNPWFFPFGEKLHLSYTPRLTGTYGCSNHLGFFLVVAICIAFALTAFSELHWLPRTLCGYLVLVMIVAVLLTGSRGSWLGFGAAAVGIALWKQKRHRFKWTWLLVGLLGFSIVAGFALAVTPGAMERISGIKQHFDGTYPLSSYVRIKLAVDALRIISDHPFFGSGPGTFLFFHPRYHGPDYGSLAYYTHNDYLNLVSDYGLVSLVFVLPFIFFVTVKLFHAPRGHWEWSHEVVRLCAVGSWCAILVHSVVDFNMHIPANAFLLFMLVGLGLRSPRGSEEQPQSAPPTLARIVAGGLLLISLFWGWTVLRTSLGYFPYYNVYKIRDKLPLEQAAETMKEAWSHDSQSFTTAGYLGDLYRAMATRAEDPKERPAFALTASEWYQKAIDLNPWDDSLLVRQGMVFDLMRRFPEASLFYATAIRHQPYNGYYHIALGAHYWRRAMLQESYKSYTRATTCPIGTEEAREALTLLNEAVQKNGLKIDNSPQLNTPHETLP